MSNELFFMLHACVALLFTILTLACAFLMMKTPPGQKLPLLCQIHPMGFMLNPPGDILVNKGNFKITASFIFLAILPGVNLLFTILYLGVFLVVKLSRK